MNTEASGRSTRSESRRPAKPAAVLGAGALVVATVIGVTLVGSPAGAAAAGSEITLTKSADKTTQVSHGAVTWTINYSCSSTVNPTCDNVKITDVLPAALLLDAADVGLVGDENAPKSGISYNPTTGTAVFSLVSPLPVGTTGQVKITVRTPVGTTPNGTVTSNVATATCSNCAATATSNPSPVTWTAAPNFREVKLVYGTSGTQVTYQIDPLANTYEGNRDLDNAVFTDALPTGAKVVLPIPNGGVYDAAKNTVTWTLTKLSVASANQFRVTVDLAGIANGTKVTNTVTGTGTNPDSGSAYPIPPASVSCVIGSNCLPQPAINAVKTVVAAQGSYQPGSLITYRLTGSVATTTPLLSPVFVDWAPAGFTYVPGSVAAFTPITPKPTSVKVETVGGRQAIEIQADGSTLAPGVSFQYTIEFAIGADVSPGSYANRLFIGSPAQRAVNGYVCNGAISAPNPGFSTPSDPTLCGTSNSVEVQQASGLVISKDGKGDSDADWQAYPGIGHSTSGGTAQWRVTIANPSTQAFTKINVLDILPSTTAVGDTEVLSATARNSKFATKLTGPIAAPAGTTVSYSTVLNPCRTSVLTNSTYEAAGCNAPAWSTTFPTSGSVTALWFAVAGPLAAGATDQFTINYTVPATTAVGDVAWNSLAFNATTSTGDLLLPAEPLKVGIAVVAPATPTPSPTPVVTPSPTPGGSGIDPITIVATPTPTPGGSGIEPITIVATPTPTVSATSAADLAATGATTYQPLLLGGALLIGGLGLLLAARRRRAAR